ncbi:MAG: SUMF1/EgtB/PvdO family nonheme iron enzyme [Bacteroides sp.]|nr:SUMF1/EgtB/PvdO family nonheme iron enzyme [Bacteroides sp.]
MKKILLILVLLIVLLPSVVNAQTPKNKVAVYMTATDVNQGYKKVIGSKMVEKITQSPNYTAVERTSDFLHALKSEQDYSVSGEVRDSQIAKIGQRLGVKFVAVVDVTELSDFEQVFVDARMINVETGEIIATASANDVVDSMNKLVGIAEKVSSGLTGGASGGNNYFGQTGSQPTGASETFTVNGVSFEMVRVDGGSFMMGSYNGDSDEQPVHSETVSTFYIGKTEVTQALWTAVMGSNPSYFKGPNLPVEMVSWNDCQEFIDRLNRITGKNFRLPTESEWEYAARGGNRSRGYDYSGSNNLQSVGWYDGNSGGSTHPVGSKLDNELGLYDMSGNVYEWTSDLWSSNYSSYRNGGSSGSDRVNRGGGYNNSARSCRSANRGNNDSGGRYRDLGFRLAL